MRLVILKHLNPHPLAPEVGCNGRREPPEVLHLHVLELGLAAAKEAIGISEGLSFFAFPFAVEVAAVRAVV